MPSLNITLESYLDIVTSKKSGMPLPKIDLDDISFYLADYYLDDAIKFRNGTIILLGFKSK